MSMSTEQIEQKRKDEKEVRSLFNEKYQAKTEDKETELPLGQTKHRFDIYERGKFIGGITTSPWKCNTVRKSNNSGGQDRASAELLWLTLWERAERRVMILTNEEMAKNLFERWKGCAFKHRIEIVHCNLKEKTLNNIGVLQACKKEK